MNHDPESKALIMDVWKMLAGAASIPFILFVVIICILYWSKYNHKERFDFCLIACLGFLIFSLGLGAGFGIYALIINFSEGVCNACALGITIAMFRIRKHSEIHLSKIICMYFLMAIALFFLFLSYSTLVSYHF